MISGWKIEYGVLKGRAGPDEYVVHECVGGWTAKRWSPEDELGVPSPTQRTCEGAVLPSLPEAIKWCEDDEKSRWGRMNFKEEEKNTSATNNENPGDKVDKFSTRIDEFVRDWEAWRARHFTAVPQPGAFAATPAANEPPVRRSPSWPLESFDARDWAKEFIRINRDRVVGIVGHVDEEDMISWFANSLMRGFEEGKKFANGSQSERALRDQAPKSPGPEGPKHRYSCIADALLDQDEGTTKRAIPRTLSDGTPNPDWESAPIGTSVLFMKDSYQIKYPDKCLAQPSDREPVAPEMSAPMPGLKPEVLRGGLPEEPGLKGWVVEDCRNAPGKKSGMYYMPDILARLDAVEARTQGLDAPELKRRLELLEAKAAVWPPARLRELEKRLGECEFRIGSTFMAPESNLSGEFVSLAKRLSFLEGQLDAWTRNRGPK